MMSISPRSCFQRSLLPAAPPDIEGLDLAVRYLPAEGDLGGDWYDIFVLPSGKVGMVMGDVEGHGLRSAVVMGRLRSALRAYALEHEDPAEVLGRLDRKLCHFESEITATVSYAVTEPPFDTLLICTAGHPPPLIAGSGQREAQEAQVPAGLILGIDPDRQRQSHELVLEQDAALVFYTDGLVERAGTISASPTSGGSVWISSAGPFGATRMQRRSAAASLPQDSATRVSRTTSR